MGVYYTIHFPDQLRQYLRAMRKKRGLTQAQAGALIGVSQARMAEIESNPGLVSLHRILQLCSALGGRLALEEEQASAEGQGSSSSADDMFSTPAGNPEPPLLPPRPGRPVTGVPVNSIEQPGSRRKKGTW